MTKTFKTSEVAAAYAVLAAAKYSKLEDADKIKVWKVARALKPVAIKFDEDSRELAEKLKPEGYDERVAKAQTFEKALRTKGDTGIGPAEYTTIIEEIGRYRQSCEQGLAEDAAREVELTFDPISEDTFAKLLASNDWNMTAAIAVSEICVG